eukprot:69656_1
MEEVPIGIGASGTVKDFNTISYNEVVGFEQVGSAEVVGFGAIYDEDSTGDSAYFVGTEVVGFNFEFELYSKEGVNFDEEHFSAIFGLVVYESLDPGSRQYSAYLTAGSGVRSYYRSTE